MYYELAESHSGLTLWEAVLYGLIQGVTEFLPVSSSGHLTLAHRAGLGSLPGELQLAFDVLLHGATLIAIGVAFRNEIAAAFRWRPKLWLCILLSILPAGIAGLLGERVVIATGSSLWMLGFFYLCTSYLLIVTDRKSKQNQKNTERSTQPCTQLSSAHSPDISYKQALWVGFFQVFALLPGISRSGTTISAGLLAGMAPSIAIAYSFLVGIPLIAAATAKDAFGGGFNELLQQIGWTPLGVAFSTALLSGIASIQALKLVVGKRRLAWFGVYCAAIALVCFALACR